MFSIGIQHNTITAACPYGLSLEEKLLPQHFKNLGYTAKMIGKWHIGFFQKEYTPTYRGFDEFFGSYFGGSDRYTHIRYQDVSNLFLPCL